MEKDSFTVQKRREEQQCFSLTLPEHLFAAKQLFGASIGLGVHVIVQFSLKKAPRGEIAENLHEISLRDTINITWQ
jgi:hypothetical protein